MTEDESLACVKLHCMSKKKEEDYEILAKELDFDIELAAMEAIN